MCGCGCGFSDSGILVCSQSSSGFPTNHHFFFISFFYIPVKIKSHPALAHLGVRAGQLLSGQFLFKQINTSIRGMNHSSSNLLLSLILPFSSGTSGASWTTRN